jgi:hypothetical protein
MQLDLWGLALSRSTDIPLSGGGTIDGKAHLRTLQSLFTPFFLQESLRLLMS